MTRHVSLPTVPPRYVGASLDAYSPRTTKQAAAVANLRQALADSHLDESGPIILCGPAGVGKTHLAVAALYAEARADEPALWSEYVFASYADLSLRWADRRQHATSIDPLVDAWMLVVDDLMPPKTAAEADALFSLIDRKYRGGSLRIVVTTNMAPVEMRQALGDRTFDRLRHGALLLALDGSSYRAVAGKAAKATP